MKFQAVATHSLKIFYSPNSTKRFTATETASDIIGASITPKTPTAGSPRSSAAHGLPSRLRLYKKDQYQPGLLRRIRISTKSNPKAKLIRAQLEPVRPLYLRLERPDAVRQSAGSGLNGQLQGNVFISFEAGDQLEHIYEDEFGSDRTGVLRNGNLRMVLSSEPLNVQRIFLFQL